jgi:ABC-type transport system involved in cytochrome bd biosynthesis fused ATPase/permease subunit
VAVAALVLGIFGTILCWFPAAVLGVPLALVGLILGILARKNAQETQQPTGMATAGLVMSIVGLVLGILLSAMCFACVSKARKDMEKMANDPQYQQQFQQQNKEFNEAFKKALEESQKQQQQQQQAPAEPTKK